MHRNFETIHRNCGAGAGEQGHAIMHSVSAQGKGQPRPKEVTGMKSRERFVLPSSEYYNFSPSALDGCS